MFAPIFATQTPIRHVQRLLALALAAATVSAGCRHAVRSSPAEPMATTVVAAPTAPAVDRLGPLGTLPPPIAGEQLPDALPDSTFWRMVTTFSEPGGYFRSENFVSNEMGLQHVISRLLPVVPPGGVYVGVGPEQNFTYVSALRPRIAFVVDIRRQNLLQHLWYKAVFELSPTRADFLSRLFARAKPAGLDVAVSADSLIAVLDRTPADLSLFQRTFTEVRDRLLTHHGFALDSSDVWTLRYVDSVFFAAGPLLNYSSGSSGGFGRGGTMPTFGQIASATDETGVNRGFLGSEATYAAVRDLQRRNLIVPIVGNFSGPSALRAVGNWIRERNARVNVFYTSNVEQYLFQQGDDWTRFYANVETMPLDTNSAFIRSVTNRRFGAPPSTFMMAQLTSSMLEIVHGARTGGVQGYGDVIGKSKD